MEELVCRRQIRRRSRAEGGGGQSAKVDEGVGRIPPAAEAVGGGGRRDGPPATRAAPTVGGGGRRDGVRRDGPPAIRRGWRGFVGGSRCGGARPPTVDPARGGARGGGPAYDDIG
ncbi:hypothetical protein PVAP13_8NG299233 [Panicum virgatum]|uniref:Uncharacterized protein n=1 Tax=Panicum virgatum TaxID=38727 RepID=A0A8T0PFS5_PANVG|nr:hypothetical protein PVAP13_8NG299233 [Panicum virgatum]